MGEVYRARDPRLGRDVAIKPLPHAARATIELLIAPRRPSETVGRSARERAMICACFPSSFGQNSLSRTQA